MRRLRPMRTLLRQRGPSAQDGQARVRFRRGHVAGGHETSEPARGPQTFHPALHPVSSPRMPVSRRELPSAFMPEDEASSHAYKNLQAKDEGGLSYLQAAHRFMLLPREALSGNEVFSAVLQQYKTEAEAATGPAEGTAGEAAPPAHGGDEHARRSHQLSAAAARASLATSLQAAVACLTAQCAEGIATGSY